MIVQSLIGIYVWGLAWHLVMGTFAVIAGGVIYILQGILRNSGVRREHDHAVRLDR